MHDRCSGVPSRRVARDGPSSRNWWRTGLALIMCLAISPEAWALTVTPTVVTFDAVQGAGNPRSQRIGLSKSSLRYSSWTVTDNAAWLMVSPGRGTITRNVTLVVGVDTAGLAAGTYSAMVTIKVDRGGSASFPVTLRVVPARRGSQSTPAMTPDTNAMASLPWRNVTGTHQSSEEMSAAPAAPFGSLTPAGMTGAGAMASRTWNPFAGTDAGVGKPTVVPATSSSISTLVPHTSRTASLTWSPVTSAGLAGYKVYIGTASGLYGTPLDVGNVTSYVVSDLFLGNTYYFVVTSYNASGTESLPSSEVSKSIY